MTLPNRSPINLDQTIRVTPEPEEIPPLAVRTRRITSTSTPDVGAGFLILRDLIIPLSQRSDTLLGRDSQQCNVVLADPRVSKLHAVIYYAGGRFFVRDLDSVNGTYINRLRLRKDSEALVAGDQILVRPYRVLFVGPEHPEVAKMVQSKVDTSKPAPAKPRSGHFSGKLEILRITDLVQLLNSTRQSGALTIRDEDNHVAELFIRDGEILTARYKEHTNEQAVYALLANTKGKFDFVQGSPPNVDDPIHKQTLSMLLEGCRLLETPGDDPLGMF